MKYYKDSQGQVHAFELDKSQDHLISDDMKKMTKAEVERHLDPSQYIPEVENNEL